ncbi:MAG: cell division protein FtsL [Gammaproteobacteria bacterium]|jgi:cell division protein FtsL|nr:cell division protein FtsL [Gammaproteobacteria bacterium]|tara:strand:+ start:126 stop:386 length:261 start_codon:yes stop_codon:yes gene_type:complete
MFNLFILFIITISAFTVVHLKHKNRTMNISIENIEQELSFELNEHKRLLDTKGKLINQKLVNTNIEKSLGMEIPSKKKIIYLDLVE